MNLSSKFLQDVNGTNFAPITTPNAVRWPNGDDLDDKLATKQAVIDSSNKLSASNVSGLATVATSGSYNDLSNKPTSLPANGGNSATVNNHTVNADVPSGAVFTDTTYVFNTAYNASTNKAATMADMPTAMGASGTNHTSGLVPDPGATAGTTKFLREDGTWVVPGGGGLPTGVN